MGRGLDPSLILRGVRMDKKVLLTLLVTLNEMLLERIAFLENKVLEYENLKQGCPADDTNIKKYKDEINDCKLKRYTTIAHIQILEVETRWYN